MVRATPYSRREEDGGWNPGRQANTAGEEVEPTQVMDMDLPVDVGLQSGRYLDNQGLQHAGPTRPRALREVHEMGLPAVPDSGEGASGSSMVGDSASGNQSSDRPEHGEDDEDEEGEEEEQDHDTEAMDATREDRSEAIPSAQASQGSERAPTISKEAPGGSFDMPHLSAQMTQMQRLMNPVLNGSLQETALTQCVQGYHSATLAEKMESETLIRHDEVERLESRIVELARGSQRSSGLGTDITTVEAARGSHMSFASGASQAADVVASAVK